MRIIKTDDYEKMSKEAACLVASEIIENPKTVLGLATGSTPLGLYKELVKMYEEGKIDFSQVTTFNLDEYIGLSNTHEQSYHYYMNNNLFSKINIKEENTYIPNGLVVDVDETCQIYEKEIDEKGPIQIQILGLGENGHIGFNEPAEQFSKNTGEVVLTDSTIEANKRFFDKKEDVPTKAVSMGIATIMKAKKIILLVNGAKKAKALKAVVEGEITPQVPGSVLQLHDNVIVIADKEAAMYL